MKQLNLKDEWKLFLKSFIEEAGPESLDTKNIKMSHSDARKIGQALSKTRQKIHQRLEKIQNEMVEIESKPRASATEQARMTYLNDQGQQLSQDLLQVDQKLKKLRDWEMSQQNFPELSRATTN